jgi:DNA-binding NarL/FixJ family response regulator
MKERCIRVVVADDSTSIREKVAELLRFDFEVVKTVADGNTALIEIRRLEPDIAVLDISMPGMSGIEIASILKKHGAGVKVVILTAHGDPEFSDAAINAGASGFVVKSRMAIDLIPALEMVRAGEVFISPNGLKTKKSNHSDNS